ncbi:MAG: hypothetical protein AAGG38_11115 [Planctomycetota bacterium]
MRDQEPIPSDRPDPADERGHGAPDGPETAGRHGGAGNPPPQDDESDLMLRTPLATARVGPARFRPEALERELGRDLWIRRGGLAVVFGTLAAWLLLGMGGSAAGLGVGLAVLVGWVALNAAGARVAQTLPRLAATVEQNPPAAESMIAEMVRKRGLTRWVRLTVYHRLAALRHRQQDFVQSAAIAQTLLTTPTPGPAAAQRPQLLLLLTEARLELHDAVGAWLALTELSRTPLSLTEALQRMALRTRYELLAGQHARTLDGIEQKVRLAELLPAPQCGALHALFATAAQRSGRDEWIRWLGPRVDLMCSPGERQRLAEWAGRAGVG